MDTLYKYYPSDTGVKVLQNQTIRFSPIAEFNDPFELRNFSRRSFTNEEFGYELYTQMVEILDSDEQLKLDDAGHVRPDDVKATDLRKIINHIKSLDQPLEQKHELIIDIAVLIAKKEIRGGPSDWQKMVHKRLSECIGALCICEVNNSLLMWAHYARNHTGAVFGLDVDKLPSNHFALRKVNYVNEFPSQDLKRAVSAFLGRENQAGNEHHIKEWMFTKSEEWSYEQEWRLLSSSDISENNHLYKYNCQLIKEVYLGYAMPPEQKDYFSKLALKLNRNVEIYEAVLSDVAYELKFEKYKSNG